ncbi:sensor histidine kinase [Chitinophaga ginsengisoli]|uniref:GHKL domain-containing protein n=1 Tax=Chitinophaga ginsengisoli TaxID=363837 RepID=A0A2P8G0Q3_9BACT|nr:histidine kinase [Chitinophaga ginsengisoli]PSL27557.1 GHKL domain-containing protein [Chitinophaga ginsengisoli]
MKHKHDDKIIQLIIDDKYRILRHSLVVLGILTMLSFTDEIRGSAEGRYLRLLSVSVFLIIMCYVNMNVLVPRFFFKGRYVFYLALLVIVVVIGRVAMSWFLSRYDAATQLQNNKGKLGIYEGTIILIAVVLVTTMVKLFQRWMRDNERMAELRNLTLTMELNELRNQINPHFLFNMLNGIKALIRKDPEKANLVIMKLSEFLRYQLYENNAEKTSLRSEINFLSNFLALEKLRRDNLSIDIHSGTPPRIINWVSLPPNLFTTFLENAVKHSVNINGAESYINVDIEVRGDKIYFSCTNSKDPEFKASDKRNSGLGLANITRRLELLYGDRYKLEVNSTEKEHTIKLAIPL